MALTNVDAIRFVVAGMKNFDPAYLESLIPSAEETIRKYCKRDLEQNTYTEYYSGNNQRDLVLKQYPVSSVTAVYFDMGGYFGQATGAFASTTQLTAGSQYVLVMDAGGTVSNRGIIRRIGGNVSGFVGFYPDNFFTGKLSAFRLPSWPRGDGNIKVVYVAGYDPQAIPPDLQFAASTLVAFMARTQRLGGNAALTSESLGGDYSYSLQLLQGSNAPEIGTVRQILTRYRDIIF